MRAFSRAIDRFCQKHRNFGISRLMLYIVIISASLFILGLLGIPLLNFFFFDINLIRSGQIWRLFTWIFMPIRTDILFYAIALFFYYSIGSTLEREWGAGKFTIFYFLGVLFYTVYALFLGFVFGNATFYLEPIYLNFSLLFAFATIFPDYTIRLFFVIPLKIKWLAIFTAAFFVFQIIMGIIAGSVLVALLPLVAVLNYILVCGDDLLTSIKPFIKVHTSPQVISFKKAAKQAKQDLADKPYRHKCAVCGKTDVDYPDMEFRYCSRCNGYHCFCSEHINNHVHFS